MLQFELRVTNCYSRSAICILVSWVLMTTHTLIDYQEEITNYYIILLIGKIYYGNVVRNHI